MNPYETDEILRQYLLFHYGETDDILPASARSWLPLLHFPVRCVEECLDRGALPQPARALDLGCAVGRSSFELARHCQSVIGIDASQAFIDAAMVLKSAGELEYARRDEGFLMTNCVARVPAEIDRSRVDFETGNAVDLGDHLGQFDVVVMANLLDRLSAPARCLARLPELVKTGGQLIVTSPYTWLEEFTPPEQWLGGFVREGLPVTTFAALSARLAPDFDLQSRLDLSFVLREHARKFQLGIAEATVWRRK